MNKKNFRKEDLQSGMVVELRNGHRYMVLNDILIKKLGLTHLNEYNEILKHLYEEKDIVKIYKSKPSDFSTIFDDSYLELIWEYKKEIDWTQIPVDTKILVSEDGKEWYKKYFAKFENGKVYAWLNGATSFSVNNNSVDFWEYAKLYESQDK